MLEMKTCVEIIEMEIRMLYNIFFFSDLFKTHETNATK